MLARLHLVIKSDFSRIVAYLEAEVEFVAIILGHRDALDDDISAYPPKVSIDLVYSWNSHVRPNQKSDVATHITL